MSHARPTARTMLMLSGILALGLASTAQAQTGTPQSAPPSTAAPAGAAPASGPDPLSGVTVDAGRRDPLRNIPPEKRAQFDREVAKRTAAKNYRASRPSMPVDSKGIADNNALSQDFQGLRTYVPGNNDAK